MDLHEAQKGGGAPIGSPHEINNLKQQLQDTKKKLEAAEKQVDEKTKAVNELENKLKVRLQKANWIYIFFEKMLIYIFLFRFLYKYLAICLFLRDKLWDVNIFMLLDFPHSKLIRFVWCL